MDESSCLKKSSDPTLSDSSFLDEQTARICATYRDGIGVNYNEHHNLPRASEVLLLLNQILELIYPGFADREVWSPATLRYSAGELAASVYERLRQIISRTCRYQCAVSKQNCDCVGAASATARAFLEYLPEIREMMKLDVQAAYDGDPAAKTLDEIVLSYPGLRAVTINRIAHFLYENKVPLVPRMMSEYAHTVTGIDIHPGAKLGKAVFIDHGTGVVIGETAELGSGVKLYQGVTLGALSFPKDACGMIIKGKKRHPTICDNVTIYAGATILGPVVIGRGSVIGGNVWLTESTEPGTKITIAPPKLTINKTQK